MKQRSRGSWARAMAGVMGVVSCLSAQAQQTAAADAIISNHTLVAITIRSGGSGYSFAPAINIVGRGGTGAGAIARISGGAVTDVAVTDGGFGYTSEPTVVIEPPSRTPYYRPLLQLGAYMTRKQPIFERGPWDDDIFWLYGALSPSPPGGRARDEGETNFPHGGTYLLRGLSSTAIIRCSDPHTRPSHADQHHVDLWIRGQNIACDAGTYLYSGDGPWRNGLAHTAVHNTVTVDRTDQMKMLTRFTWTDWSQGKVLRHDEKVWQGEPDGYARLADPVTHRRTVISLAEDRWLTLWMLTG